MPELNWNAGIELKYIKRSKLFRVWEYGLLPEESKSKSPEGGLGVPCHHVRIHSDLSLFSYLAKISMILIKILSELIWIRISSEPIWIMILFELIWIMILFELIWIRILFEPIWIRILFELIWIRILFELIWIRILFRSFKRLYMDWSRLRFYQDSRWI